MKDIKSQNKFLFDQNSKISFNTFDNLIICNRDLTLLNLISSVINNANFDTICFYNSSFLSTKFQKVFFNNCNIENADICSIWAKDCSYYKCSFDNSTISDSTFINCKFEITTFNNISLINCQFINCIFEQMPIDNSTVTLNTFISCHINKTHFTESFYYQIFEDCIFRNVEVAIELLGYNFGLFPDVLNQSITNKKIKEAETEFLERGLFINAAILHINMTQNFYDKAIIACIIAMNKMIQNDILIKADEINFLQNLTLYLEEKNKITPLSVIRIWSELNKTLKYQSNNTSLKKAYSKIREYINTIYFDFQKFLENLQNNIICFSENRKTNIELKIIYQKQPILPLIEILNEISILIDPECERPKLIRVEKGSFIEFHQIALEVMPYLQTFFSILGIFVPIAIYHDEKKKLTQLEKKDLGKEENKMNELEIKTTINNNSTSILLPNSTFITPSTNDMVVNIIKICEKQNLEKQVGFCGYNQQNIQSITIRFK